MSGPDTAEVKHLIGFKGEKGFWPLCRTASMLLDVIETTYCPSAEIRPLHILNRMQPNRMRLILVDI